MSTSIKLNVILSISLFGMFTLYLSTERKISTPAEIQQNKESLFVVKQDSSAPSLGYFQLGAHVADFDLLEDNFEDNYRDSEGDAVNFAYDYISHELYGDNVTLLEAEKHTIDLNGNVELILKTVFDSDNKVALVKNYYAMSNASMCEAILGATIASIKEKYNATLSTEAFSYSTYTTLEDENYYEKYLYLIDNNIRFEVAEDCDHSSVSDFYITLYTVDSRYNKTVLEVNKNTVAQLLKDSIFPIDG